MDLDDWEHVTCVKTVNLSYEGTRSGLKGYVAVGTNYNYSEDITSKGRVRMSTVIKYKGFEMCNFLYSKLHFTCFR